MKLIKIILTILLALFVLGILADAPQTASDTLKPFQAQVAQDFEAQYAAVVQNGTPIDRCVRAGLVAEGYLQASDNANFAKWMDVKEADCKAANVTY